MIWLRLIQCIARLFPKREIYAEDSKLYLERYRVFGWTEGSTWRGPSLYLHRFCLPDQDVALHNHPWRRAFSLILAGGYDESRAERRDSLRPYWPNYLDGFTYRERTLRAGNVNTIGPETYHRITALHGEVWTLFFVWPKSRSWGFWIPGRGHVGWKERLAERGIPL